MRYQDSRYEQGKSVLESIFWWSSEQPEVPAIINGSGELSYGEFWELSSRWACALAESVPGRHEVVGVLRGRGAGVPVCELAVWLSGAAYIPLDPALPPARIAMFLREAHCNVVLTAPELQYMLPQHITAITEPATHSPQGKIPPVTPELAYVIFTSGSTGVPKGVEVRHRSLAMLMAGYTKHFNLKTGSRASMLANLGFDCLILEIWGALSAGATLIIPGKEVAANPQELVPFLDANAIGHAFVGTAALERLLTSGLRPRTLDTIITAGDVLRIWPPDDYTCAVYNSYGPTEATVLVTISADLRSYPDKSSLPPIGQALPGAEVWIESADGAPISTPGVAGELIIGASYLARGYLHRPDLTERAFTRAGTRRRYRTGDTCRWRPDGDIEFVGRRDRQVKLKGQRVELGEIENAILQCHGVAQVAVVLVGEPARRRLYAWIEGSVDVTAISEAINAILPSYMIPDAFGVLDALPVNPNGKIDRSALEQLIPSGLRSQQSGSAAGN